MESQLARIQLGGVELSGNLEIPGRARGVVLFAHGSGSSRFSPRNRFVAAALAQRGLATLLVDLLTADEERAEAVTRHLRFDISLLTSRLLGLIGWLAAEPATRHLRLGLFGSSTGAAGALRAAATRPDLVAAVVSRGGRPDLAGVETLRRVESPTLLLVGGDDEGVLELNEQAFELLGGVRRLQIVPGATHLFEEPGALEQVAMLAADWFSHFLSGAEVAWIQSPGEQPSV